MLTSRVGIISAKRSPIGKLPGVLNTTSEIDLVRNIFRSVTQNIEKTIISDAMLGCSFPNERDNLCRKAVMKAGLPFHISSVTISKTCASSDEALFYAYCKIMNQKCKAIIVGGCEKAGNSGYILKYMKKNVKNQLSANLPTLEEVEIKLQENDMAYINESLAEKYRISRKEQDDYTIKSIGRAIKAKEKQFFMNEIEPVTVNISEEKQIINDDELLANSKTKAEIYNAAPMFIKGGTVTDCNAAPICESAAAVVLMNCNEAVGRGINPLVVIKDIMTIGAEKSAIGENMSMAISNILSNNNLNTKSIDLYEINESFAAQVLAVIKALHLDIEKVNVNGGNLALGYPIGATGMRMLVSLTYEMIRRNVRYGLSVMCAGGYMANAVLLENYQYTR